MNQVGRWILFVLGLALFGQTLRMAVRDATPPPDVRLVKDYEPWDEETLELAESFPVQDGGRIKPLTTYAGFTMLRLYGARSMKIKPSEDAEAIKLKPIAWMMDALFRPQFAMEQPSFRIDDSAVVDAIGVDSREKRDRYSYKELEPGRQRLFELARGYGEIEKKNRTPLENQILALAENYQSYEHILGVFALSRNGLAMMSVDGLPENESTPKLANASAVMATAPIIRQVLQDSQSSGKPIPDHIQNLLEQVLDGANASKFGMFLFPPAAKDDEHWLSPGERVMNAMTMQTRDFEGSVKDIEKAELAARGILASENEFRKHFGELKADVVSRAKDRGEYRSIELEADYYRKNWFLYALVFFLIGTVFAIAMWMVRGMPQRILSWCVWGTTLLGGAYVVIPIVKRCIIMERPPVGNLYDTIIFITAAIVVFGSIVELLTRRRFALGLMPIAGVALIVLARLFEVGDGKDHMDPLVAVLRSNYWLTIHVITITLGYAGGLVAALLGMVYVLLRGLRLDGGDKGLRRSLTRAVYGMVCLTLFLSLVGTVLGGIWANDSWGRFWGWDPKENGALMIVLASLAILHARVGGFIKEWGIHLTAICLAAIVTFSWWHVNLLGTGLHNYGFTDGGGYVNLVYLVVLVFLGFGGVSWFIEKVQADQRKAEAIQARQVSSES